MPVPVARQPAMTKTRTKLPTAVGVHIFAGGFTCGVKAAGFKVLAHLEAGKYGVSTAKLNWPDLPVHVGEENWPLTDLAGKVDFMYCNPMCAPWSTAGPSTTKGPDAWRTDPRTEGWKQCFRVLAAVRPKVFAIESVTQIYSKGREFIDERTHDALNLGYSVTHILLDAKWTGVPQSRRRFFLIAYLPSIDFRPGFSFAKPPTVGEALASVADSGHVTERRKNSPYRQIYLECIRKTPQGGKLRDTFDEISGPPRKTERGTIAGRPGFLVCRLDKNRQMGAFIGDVFFHPTENRCLGVNEMKSLCGYPRNFKLAGTPGQHASLLARAVLPPVGKWLGQLILRALNGPRLKLAKKRVRLFDLRSPGMNSESLMAYYLNRSNQDADTDCS